MTDHLRHSGESWNPSSSRATGSGIPAFSGMTGRGALHIVNFVNLSATPATARGADEVVAPSGQSDNLPASFREGDAG